LEHLQGMSSLFRRYYIVISLLSMSDVNVSFVLEHVEAPLTIKMVGN
jgi:hypothetical protein